MLTNDISNTILLAEAKALATYGPQGVNVVPVSVVVIEDGTIKLFNFFMGKTIENISQSNQVALTAWTGLSGVQVKASVVYEVEGDAFNQARVEMRKRFPERTLHGVLILSPLAVYDISVGSQAGLQLT